jgi:hypothetical protein
MVLAGCSTGSTGDDAQPSSAAASSSATGALDTGTFATTARAPFGVARGPQLPALESQRLAEFVTLSQEIDARFSRASLPLGALVNTRSINDLFGLAGDEQSVSTAAIDNRLAAGFYGTAGEPGGTALAPGASATHGVIRFSTPADAQKAARAMYDALLAGPRDITGKPRAAGVPVTDPTLPDSLVFTLPAQGQGPEMLKSTTALTTRAGYVIVDVFVEPQSENGGIAAIRRSLALQIPLIDRFPATPTRGGQVQQDQDKILIYTLTNPDPRTALNDGVFGPRGYAFTQDNQQRVMQQLVAAGAEHIAVSGTTVFRAKTPEAAETLMGQLVGGGSTAAAQPPPGLPSAKCLAGSTGVLSDCFVQVGRYIGEAAAEDLTQAHQKISAQYRILQNADQNAN